MEKQKIVDVFKTGHDNLCQLLDSLTSDQLVDVKVLGEWSVKDILAHLAAWNWEQIREIDNVLKDQPTWNDKFKSKEDQDDFNNKAVKKRKNKNIAEIIKEWNDSFGFLISRVEKLTDKQWNYKCEGYFENDGKILTMQSLFHYEKNGLSDDGKHANQIRKFFKSYK